MPVLMIDEADRLAPPVRFIAHIKRPLDGESLTTARALCGDKWGAYAVADAGAELPPLLPVEFICETCAAAHVAGSA